MIFFRVTKSMNIKTTDLSLVPYKKFRFPNEVNNETIYISTYDDFSDLEKVFEDLGETFKAKLYSEKKVRDLEEFPIELGILNLNEFENVKEDYFHQNESLVELEKQIKDIQKDEISVVIVGGVGVSISEIISSSIALKIFYEKLKESFKKVEIDLYLNASNNGNYSRDKSIYECLGFLNKIRPLSLNVREFCNYDCFVDTSSFMKSSYFKNLNHTDAWLYKFGIDYKKVLSSLKHNSFDLSKVKIKQTLKDRIENIKKDGKILLYHPYCSNRSESIPKDNASEILKKLLKKREDYTIVSGRYINGKIRDSRYEDLSLYTSKIVDFMYLVSQADEVLTVDSSTYHISEAFMVPTVVLSLKDKSLIQSKYYNFVKTIQIKDKSKNMSKFIFENSELIFYRFQSWKKLKVSKIISLLESF